MPTPRARHPHRLDMPAPTTAARQAGDEAHLQRAHHFAAALRHREQLVGIGLDGIEPRLVIRQRRPLARRTDEIVRQQCGDGGNIGAGGAADEELSHA